MRTVHFAVATLFCTMLATCASNPAPKPAAVLEIPPPPAAPVAPAPPAAPAAPAMADEREAVSRMVSAWAAAWSAGDAAAYLAAYSPAFVPEHKLARATWEKHRRERLATPKNVRVKIEQLKWEPGGPARGRVVFLQRYRAHSYSDDRRKVLELEKREGSWQITREYIP